MLTALSSRPQLTLCLIGLTEPNTCVSFSAGVSPVGQSTVLSLKLNFRGLYSPLEPIFGKETCGKWNPVMVYMAHNLPKVNN